MKAIRITTECDDSVIQTFLEIYGTRYLWVVENPETNRHYHVLLDTDRKTDTLRKALAKQFGRGNKTFSLTECKDEIAYVAYMIKEGTLCGTLLEWDDDFYTSAKEHDANQKKLKKERASKGPVWQKILTQMESRGEDDWSPGSVTRSVIDYTRENETLVREFFMVSMIQTILLKKNPEYSIQLETSIMDKITKVYM